MKKLYLISSLCLAALSLLLLCGCVHADENIPSAAESLSPAPTESPVSSDSSSLQSPSPSPGQPLEVLSIEDVQSELTQAIDQLRQPSPMDIGSLALEQPELDVKNLYYQILSLRPEFKYAYDLSVSLDSSILNCTIFYMPYKTGQYPAGFEGIQVQSLSELIAAAENNLSSGSIAVRIMDTSLEPDEMNKALQQAGGGYFSCTLNQDATAIVFNPPVSMTAQDCMQAMAQAEELADSVISQLISEDMSQEDRAWALYSWLCSNVEYDQRYYSDKSSMPYESQTALGALRDGTAICGGYSHALKLLFEKAGIPCFNVTGVYYGEYHMWNIACLDGRWLWFDATSDRGSDGQFGYLRFALDQLDTDKYQWNDADVQALINQ